MNQLIRQITKLKSLNLDTASECEKDSFDHGEHNSCICIPITKDNSIADQGEET